jgi:hypothetical protein
MDFNELIPELSQWNSGKGIHISDWINCIGNFEAAIGYGSLFWPEFIEHDGCILLAASFEPENYRSWMKQLHGDRTAVERALNHRHLGDFFPNAPAKSMQQKFYMARLLKEIWECKLARDFPGQTIVVELIDCEERGEEWQDCQITIYCKR